MRLEPAINHGVRRIHPLLVITTTTIDPWIHVPVLRKAFLTYVTLVLENASNVWAPYLIRHINALEKVQKHFKKHFPYLANLSYPERLAALDLEPLELRRLKPDLVVSTY